MSGIGKAVKKVVKGVGSLVKKYWKPLAIAAAVYFTAGAATSLFGAGGAVGGAGAAVGEAGAGVGALTGEGIAAGAEAAATGVGSGVLSGATLAAGEAAAAPWAAGLGAMGLTDAGVAAGSGIAGSLAGGAGIASSLGSAAVDAVNGGGPIGWGQAVDGVKSVAHGITSSVGNMASSAWNSLTGGKGLSGLLNNRGAMDLIGKGVSMYAQSEMANNAEKYKTERAPFQLGKGTDFASAYNLGNQDNSQPTGYPTSTSSFGSQSPMAATQNPATAAPLSAPSIQAMNSSNTPFAMTTALPNAQTGQQGGLINYMQHVPSFMEGPYGDQSLYS